MKIIHNDYKERRAIEYPPVEDQLDMLWHAMDSGQILKVQPFYDEIKRIKERFPKPSQ